MELGEGDVEQVLLTARADDDQLHRWRLCLPLLIDGRREFHEVKVDEPLITIGSA